MSISDLGTKECPVGYRLPEALFREQSGWNAKLNTMISLIYLLTAFGLTPGGSSTVRIYTQTMHRKTQLTTLVGKLSGIRAQRGQPKTNNELTALKLLSI